METQTFSQKQGALVAILQLGGYVKDVGPIVNHMRSRMEIETDLHNVAHVLWPLSKENRVTFQERKVHGGESSLSNIRITERGVQTARSLLGLDKPTNTGKLPHVVVHVSGGRAAHAVGRDQTDFRQHSTVAIGGPIERRVEKETPLDYVPFVVLSEEEAAQFRNSKGAHKPPVRHSNIEHEAVHHEETVSVSDEADVSPRKEEHAEVIEKHAEVAASDTPTEYREPDAAKAKHALTWLPDHYPLIAATLGKRERIERYTKAAELLGDDEAEIAIALLEKIKISPLEEEIIRLLG